MLYDAVWFLYLQSHLDQCEFDPYHALGWFRTSLLWQGKESTRLVSRSFSIFSICRCEEICHHDHIQIEESSDAEMGQCYQIFNNFVVCYTGLFEGFKIWPHKIDQIDQEHKNGAHIYKGTCASSLRLQPSASLMKISSKGRYVDMNLKVIARNAKYTK